VLLDIIARDGTTSYQMTRQARLGILIPGGSVSESMDALRLHHRGGQEELVYEPAPRPYLGARGKLHPD
jgi:hypothetical protein